MRNRTTRVWAMIDADFHQDEDLELIAGEHGPKALAYWAILICESKKVHRGKKDGWAGPFTLTQFAALCYDEKTTKKSLQKMLQLFVDRGLLELKGELTGRWRSRPTNFAALQNKGRNAVDQANSRGNMQGNDDERQVPVRRESDDSQTVVSDSHGRAGLDVDVDIEASKLASQNELIRAVDFLVSIHPSLEARKDGLLQQLSEFVIGENRPSPQHVLDAALEVGPSIQYPGKAYRLIAARAQSLKQNEPKIVGAPKYVPPPGAEAFRALIAQDEAEGLAS